MSATVLEFTKKKENIHEPLIKERIFAFIADFVIISLLHGALMYSMTKFYESLVVANNPETIKFFKNILFQADFSIYLTIYLGYFTICNYLGHGQTLGKFIFHIRSISTNDMTLSFSQSFKRAIGHTISYFFAFMPLVMSAYRKDAKNISDFMASSKTVTEEYFQSIVVDADESSDKDDQLELFKEVS